MGTIINRRRVMGGKLPYDAEIEYLESTGTQWIDTEKSLGNNFEIETRFCCTQYTSQEQSIFSIWITHYKYWNVYIRRNRTISLYVDRNNPTTNIVNTNIDYNLSLKRSENTYTLTFGDEVIVDTLARNDNPTTLKLFTRGDTPSINYSNSHIKIYKCKVYIDDELVRDFIPVRVGSVGYLYDKVSGQLFGNAGTGDFILGVDKGLQNYTEIEYLESTGTQYIDTGIVPNTRLAFSIELQQTSEETSKIALGGRLSSSSYDYSLWMGKESIGAHYCKGTDSSSYDTRSIYTGDMTDRFHLVTVSYVGISMDGNSIYTFPDIPFLDGGGESLAIFALKDSGNYDSRTFKGRIKKVVIELNGIIVRDYIPVRVGQVGYMYDKVSGQLFDNSGTGDFILGPDK